MNLLFLDTETGGLNPFKHSLLQVGLAAYKNGMVIDTLEFTLAHDKYIVTEQAMKVNGLDLKKVKEDGLSPKEAIAKVIEFVGVNFGKEKPILVGHNPSIDKYMLRQLFESMNFEMDDYMSHRMIDTMSLIWGLHIAGKLPIQACSSNGAFEYFGIEVKKRHNALDDCLATVELYKRLIQLLSK